MFKRNRLRVTAIAMILFMVLSTCMIGVEAASYSEQIATAEAELASAQNKLTELKKTEATAKTAYENAKPSAAEASLIGFLSNSTYGMGWTNALNYFNNINAVAAGDASGKVCTSYTSIGQNQDATSLEGLLRSLELFEEGNTLRNKEGASTLEISARAMLVAAIECNYYANSGYNRHTYVTNMGNNLAKSYEDPFDGWYTKEKANYQSGTGTTGHYLALIDKSYTYGGFATIVGNYEGTYSAALNRFCMTFDGVSTNTVIMDVDTVKTKAKNYINYINNYGSSEKAAYKKAQAAVTAQEKVVAEKQAALTALKPTSVSLNNTTFTLTVGKTTQLTATVKPATAYSTVTWSSSNTAVATVLSDGTVKGVKAGTATITAKTANGKTATCSFTIKAASSPSSSDSSTAQQPTSVSLSSSSLSINVGSSSSLTATVKPSTANSSVTWSSSNTAVATVSYGKVTGVKAGTATITVKTTNGKTATCSVTVKATSSSSSSDSSSSSESSTNNSIPIYRLYFPGNGEHLFTSSYSEYQTLYKKYGWGQEGIAWYAPAKGVPVYRLYHPGLRNHLYTVDTNEVRVLTTKYGWVADNNGEALYYSGGSTKVYRVYNRAFNGLHHLTTGTAEYNTLPKYGWKQEGVAMYAVSLGKPLATTKYYK